MHCQWEGQRQKVAKPPRRTPNLRPLLGGNPKLGFILVSNAALSIGERQNVIRTPPKPPTGAAGL
jgi:hypothetical protein